MELSVSTTPRVRWGVTSAICSEVLQNGDDNGRDIRGLSRSLVDNTSWLKLDAGLTLTMMTALIMQPSLKIQFYKDNFSIINNAAMNVIIHKP